MQGSAALLDDGIFQVPAQIAMHDRARTAYRTVGARASARRHTAASRCESASDAPAARDGYAPVRHDEGAHGGDAHLAKLSETRAAISGRHPAVVSCTNSIIRAVYKGPTDDRCLRAAQALPEWRAYGTRGPR